MITRGISALGPAIRRPWVFSECVLLRMGHVELRNRTPEIPHGPVSSMGDGGIIAVRLIRRFQLFQKVFLNHILRQMQIWPTRLRAQAVKVLRFSTNTS